MFSQLINLLHIPKSSRDLSQAQRLFHGRGHAYKGLEHITIDWLPPVILITLFSPESNDNINKLTTQLKQCFPLCESIQLQHRYQQLGPIDTLWGKQINRLIIQENNLLFQLQLGKSRNTGLFLDMKNGREWVKNNSKDKRVLNLFAYTCGFSIAAIAGRAKSVLNIDSSSPALEIGRINHHLNKQALNHVRFEKLNIFKSFGRIKKRGPFDLLICDPPTFQKGSIDIAKDYPKIIRRLTDFMAPGGTLMLCLNAPELNREFLSNMIDCYAPHFQYVEEIRPPDVYQEAQNKGLIVLIYAS